MRSQQLRCAGKRTTRTIKILFTVPAFLHSVTMHPMSYLGALLPGWRWVDCDFPILNKVQCLALFSRSLGKSLSWQEYSDGGSGDGGIVQLCLGQHQFFFASETRSRVLGNFSHLPFPFPFSVLLFLCPKAVSCGIMTQSWALCSSSRSCISHSSCEKEGEHFVLWAMTILFFLHLLSWLPIAFQTPGKELARLVLSTGAVFCVAGAKVQ